MRTLEEAKELFLETIPEAIQKMEEEGHFVGSGVQFKHNGKTYELHIGRVVGLRATLTLPGVDK